MAATSYVDPDTGHSVLFEGGLAILRERATGELYRVAAAQAKSDLASGDYLPATPQQIEIARIAKEHGGAVGQGKAAGAAFAAGAIDAVTGLPRLATYGYSALTGAADPLADLTGRNVVKAAVGPEGERALREREELYPTTSAVAGVAGQVAGLALGDYGLSKIASLGRLGLVAKEAVVGGGLGLSQTVDEAARDNVPLTTERALAGIGLGAVFGGGASAVLQGAAPAYRGLRAKLGRVPAPEALANQAGTVLGDAAAAPNLGAKLRDAVESAQSAVSGAEESTLKKYGALRWDDQAREGRRMWRDRDAIIEGATRDLTGHIDEVVQKSSAIQDEVRDVSLKRSHVASTIAGDADTQIAAARSEVRRIQDVLASTSSDVHGNLEIRARLSKFVNSAAKDIDAAGATPADAFIALDRVKRGLQRRGDALGAAAGKQIDPLLREQTHDLGTLIRDVAEGPRGVLMDEALWGPAASAQKAINAKWEQFFDSRRIFNSSFLTQVGDTYGGPAVMAADPAKVGAYMRRLGTSEGALTDQYLRAHITALDELAGAIGTSFEVGPKSTLVSDITAAASRARETLARADATVKTANQIDAVLAAERSGSMSAVGGAAVGGLLGGPAGAVIGAGLGGVVRPGRALVQAAAIDAMARQADSRIGRVVASLIERPAAKAGAGAAKAPPARVSAATAGYPRAEVAVGRGVTGAAVTGYARMHGQDGEDERGVSVRRARLAAQLATDPLRLADALTAATGDLMASSPAHGQALQATVSRAAQYLHQESPASQTATPLTPHLDRPTISVSAARRYASQWEAATQPMRALARMERGDIRQEQIGAIKAVYPALYDDLRAKAAEYLAQRREPVGYHAARRLDSVLGLGGASDRLFTAGFHSRLSAAVAEDTAKRQRTRNAAAQSSGASALAKASQTQSQRLANGG